MTDYPLYVSEPGFMSLEEWGALDEDVEGELVNGVLVREEEVSWVHDVLVGWLAHVLWGWLKTNGGQVATSDVRYGISPARGRKPDLSVYLPGTPRPSGRSAVMRLPPTIAVEVVSPRPNDIRRDRVEKLADYAIFGVAWYWIVDPQARTFEVFRLSRDGTGERALGAGAGRVEVPGCAGLVVDLDELWAQAASSEAEDPG